MRSAAVWVAFFLASLSAYGAHCDLWEDSLRITHVRTSDAQGATYCLGYLHGRDRAWQMDYFRRTTHGENAEIYGFSHLKGDMMMRLLDLKGQAEKLWDRLAPTEQRWLKDYSTGVNHGFRVARQQPTGEFRDGYPLPREWKPQHTLAVMLLQAFDQTKKTFITEWEENKARDRWGEQVAPLYDPDGVPWDTTVLKAGEYPVGPVKTAATPSASAAGRFWQDFPSPFGEHSGSNNWVVAPSRSRSGHALLANDPHLDLKTPLFWYWAHLEAPGLDAVGASLPGIPTIVSGTNRRVSWGLTNSYVNTADIVRIEESEAKELQTVRPMVWVKWGFLKLPIFFKTFLRTADGVPALPLESADQRPLLLKWSAFHLRGVDVAPLRELMSVSSAQEAENVFSRVGLPSWNFVFADVDGKIGHRVVGRGIKATSKDAFGVRDGKLAEARAPAFYDPSEMPHVYNPKRGWIATANNRHWPPDATFYGGRGYAAGFRAFRLDELLAATPKHDRESFLKIQCDTQATDGRFLAPLMLRALSGAQWEEAQTAWLEKLRGWDFSAGLDCEVCGIYRRVLEIAYAQLQIEEIGFWRLGQQDVPEWRDAVRAAFQQAWGELGPKKWGDIHLNPFKHLSGNAGWSFSPSIPTPGDKHSLNPGSVRWNEETRSYEHTSGASQRLVVEMKPVPEAWVVLPGLNNRYDQHEGLRPWKDWAECRQHRIEWPLAWSGLKTEKVEVEL